VRSKKKTYRRRNQSEGLKYTDKAKGLCKLHGDDDDIKVKFTKPKKKKISK
jgi:hypothetical protein